MPTVLNLESLDTRDAAWREAQEGPPERRIPLTSSSPPPYRTSHNDDPTRLAAPRAAPLPQIIEAPPRSSRRFGLFAALGVAGALAAALIVLVVERNTPTRGPRFVVVERPTPERAEPEPQALAPAQSAATGLASASTATVSSSVAAGPPPSPSPVHPPSPGSTGKPDPQALSRTFARKRGSIESCFRKQAEQVQGRPQLSVRFTVAKSGSVKSAELMPQSLAGTELGQCVLSIARSTNFGPQSEEVTFSIPITARKVE